MKKFFFWILFFLSLLLPVSIHADINSSSLNVGNGCQGKDSCWQIVGTINGQSATLTAMRVTVFNEKAERVSDSIDLAINSVQSGYGVKRINSKISKIEYLNGQTPQWVEGNLNDLVSLPSDSDIMQKIIDESNVFNDNIQDTGEKVAAKWFENNGFSAIPIVKEKLQYCSNKYISKCNENYKYYAVFEPITSVIVNGTRYYGTEYELAHNKTIWDANWVGTVIRSNIPNALYVTGEFPNFYSNAKIGSRNGTYNIHKSGYYERDEALIFGVGIGVFEWKHPEDKIITRKKLTCNVNVNLTECGESSIYEVSTSNNKEECIVDNPAYSYDVCNLYCADTITTNFSGFYKTFIGNNALKAIKSGKYISIKSNPKITINKTCYQSSPSQECTNVYISLKNKLDTQYQENKIYLNVDGKKYELKSNVPTQNITYDSSKKEYSATITYEYKLDENINKYIDIETMKGILNPNDKTYNNDGPTIITSKGTYGKYKYSFDVSETPLNKYTSSSSALRKLKNTQSERYDFTNNITINYTSVSGDKKTNYTNDDLKNTTCTYVKYNPDEGCICPENKCCDSITCEVLEECPPDPDGNDCTCTGKYGCYDDGKCTPIPDPTPGDKDDECDPDKKVCFPNIIYRPISLVEPFPGINGDKRTPGNNWNKVINTSNGKVYSYGDYYIRNRRGYKDYEIYQAEPLYVIKLDGAKIQAIRKYNDKHNYNDFELTCINGESCISKFLRGTTQDFSINLIESGTCKNINNYNFNSCIKNKGE